MLLQSLLNLGKLQPQMGSCTRAIATTSAMKVNGKLAGKVAIVTASTDGIGLGIAKDLGKNGAHVVVSSRNTDNVEKAVEELHGLGYSVLGVPCHVAKKNQRESLVNETVDKFGGIDILVSNAAFIPTLGGVLDCTDDEWDQVFEVNVKSAFQLTKLVVPHMYKKKAGSIIYISSISAYCPVSALGAYNVSKTALLGLTKAVAQQVAPDNIRVNCLVPGAIDTKMSQPLLSNKEFLKKFTEMIPLGRVGQPNEMGGIVSFLASDEASYITGESFVAAGGMVSRL